MSQRASSVAIGLFVVVAATLAVAILVLVGGGSLWRRTYSFVVYFHGSVAGLDAGAPVKFRGVDVGTVRGTSMVLAEDRSGAPDFRIPVVIALDPAKIKRREAEAVIGSSERMNQLIDAGLRAQLETSSFVTNMRYVSLDIIPGSPKEVVADPSVPYPEIPTMPTPLENAQKNVSEVLAQLSRAEIEGSFRSAHQALEGVNRLVNGPEIAATLRSIQHSAESLDETLATVRSVALSLRRLGDEVAPDVAAISKNVRRASEGATRIADGTEALLATIHDLLEPTGPALFRFEQSLAEVSATARSLRHLVDKVDRDPAVLIRGGNP